MKASMLLGINCLVIVLLTAIVSTANLMLFIDFRSALIVVGIVVSGILVSYGSALPVKAVRASFEIEGIKEAAELQHSVKFFNTAPQLSIAG